MGYEKVRPAKYFNTYRTKAELLRAVKNAEKNIIFFSRETMRFFGKQKFSIVDSRRGPCLRVRFLRHPRTTYYSIDAHTLRLTHTDAVQEIRV